MIVFVGGSRREEDMTGVAVARLETSIRGRRYEGVWEGGQTEQEFRDSSRAGRWHTDLAVAKRASSGGVDRMQQYFAIIKEQEPIVCILSK